MLSAIYFARSIKHKRDGDVYATGEIIVNSSLLFFNIALVVVSKIGMFVENNALFVLAIVCASITVALFIASIVIIIKRNRVYDRDLDADEKKGLLAYTLVEMLLQFFWF